MDTELTITEQAKKAAQMESAQYEINHPRYETGHYVQQLLNQSNQEKDAEIGRLKERCEHWIKDAQDAVNGVYGNNPKAESEDYWRGRVAALTDLHAFIPPTKF